MINNFSGVGRMTKDIEIRQTQNGKSVGSFNLAINRTFTNQQGERVADFIPCVVFGNQADNMQQYTGKGSLVGVTGRLQHRTYENQEGRNVHVYEIVCQNVSFLDTKNNNNQQNNGYQQTGQAQQNKQKPMGENPFANANGPIDVSDDDLPF